MAVTLYTTTTCAPCRLVAKKLTDNGIPFEKVVLDLPENAEELASLKARLGTDVIHTPTLDVDGVVVMRGMDPFALAGVLATQKELHDA